MPRPNHIYSRSGKSTNDHPLWHWNTPSAPMETSLTPLLAMKSRALLTLAILWNLILPLSGFCRVSPEMTSRSSMSLRPLRKSSSMFSICVPAFLRCEFTHAVKVWKRTYQISSISPRLSKALRPHHVFRVAVQQLIRTVCYRNVE